MTPVNNTVNKSNNETALNMHHLMSTPSVNFATRHLRATMLPVMQPRWLLQNRGAIAKNLTVSCPNLHSQVFVSLHQFNIATYASKHDRCYLLILLSIRY